MNALVELVLFCGQLQTRTKIIIYVALQVPVNIFKLCLRIHKIRGSSDTVSINPRDVPVHIRHYTRLAIVARVGTAREGRYTSQRGVRGHLASPRGANIESDRENRETAKWAPNG